MKSKHNGIISLWKFIFCIVIIGFHLNVIQHYKNTNFGFLYGSIAVEFFFIVSGYLLAKKALTMQYIQYVGETTKNYILNKIKKIFPYLLFSFIIGFIVTNIYGNYTKSQNINSVFDLFFMYCSGIKYVSMIPIVWYLSAMLIADIILFPLIYKYKENYIYIICPIVIFLLAGYLSHNYGQLTKVQDWMGITTVGTLRGMLTMNIGALMYTISEKIKKLNYTKLGSLVLTIIEITGFISIFFIIQTENAHAKYDFIMVIIMAISIMLAFSEKTLLLKFLNNKFVYYLEKLSLPVFLNQHWLLVLMNNIIKSNGYDRNFYIEFIIAIVLSIIVGILELSITKLIKKLLNKIKPVFVKI